MIDFDNAVYNRDGFDLAINFKVGVGRFVAVLGPSGAGKSTVLNLIAGFEHLRAGRILLNGTDVAKTPPAERPVSMVFQDNNSFAHLDVRSNVAVGLAPDLKLSMEQWKAVDAAIGRVGLAQLTHRKPGELSGGERQRIAVARVLVRQMPILLLDEAFAALGPALSRDMLDLVKQLAHEKNLTVLMVTHNPWEAKYACDEVVFIDAGIARAPIAMQAFIKTRKDAAIKRYLGAFD